MNIQKQLNQSQSNSSYQRSQEINQPSNNFNVISNISNSRTSMNQSQMQSSYLFFFII